MNGSQSLAPWSWLVPLAAGAAIFALYFLKTRRKPVLVPSTLLWRRTIEDQRVNALWQRLRKSVLLLMQLLAVAAAAVALFRPSWQGSILRGGQYVFLIDNSAAMATTDVAPTRLDEAKSRVLALIDQMGSGDSAMVVSFAASAKVEVAFTDSRERLRRAVREIRQTAETSSLTDALRLCVGRPTLEPGVDDAAAPPTEHVVDAHDARIFVFSDGNFAPVTDEELAGLQPQFIPIGTSTVGNFGVTRFAVRRSIDAPRRAQALARIHGFQMPARRATLELRVDDRLIDAREIDLPASRDESTGVATAVKQDVLFTVDDAPDGVWEVRLEAGDPFSLDDRGWAVLSPPAKSRLLLVSPGERFLAAALATSEARRWCDATFHDPEFLKSEEYRAALAAGAFDLIVFDRCRPETMPEANSMYFDSLPPGDGWRRETAVDVPQVLDTAQSHPLMQNISFRDVVIAAATPLSGPSGSQALVDARQGALCVSSARGGFEDVVWGLALEDEKRALQTNWPLVDGAGFEQFVLNAVQYFGRARLNGDDEVVRPGNSVPVAVGDRTEDYVVVGPDGRRTPLRSIHQGTATFYATDRLGPYRVSAGETTQSRFVVNLFDVQESQPAVPASPQLHIGHEKITAQAVWDAARLEGWRPFLLLVLALLAIEWYIYGVRAAV